MKEQAIENVVDRCSSYDILLMDSGLLPKPNRAWKTFVPKIDDIAYVEDTKYIFNGTSWVEYIK